MPTPPTASPLNATFLDYAIPTAEDLPPIEQGFQHTPSPANPLGVKGIGEVPPLAPHQPSPGPS